ncbi:MAG: cation-translocating P-type ATPase [Bacteroidota bacterium]|nr:cation-translocating P-type ATPase [Bacteroidota bacterium]
MSTKEQQEILKIEGMSCANCALGIKKHLDQNGVQNVHVNFASAEAYFTKTQTHNFDKVKELIQAIGYNVRQISDEQPESSLSEIEKKFIFTLPFTIPLFAHMFLPKDNILHNALIQFILCLPVFILGCIHFGKSAYSSLKSGLPNMDVLIFMGSSAAFFYSIYGWMIYYSTEQAHHFLFFETTATIITLVLLGNVLEDRSVRQTTTAIRELSEIKKGIAKKEVNDKIEEVDFDQVIVNDTLIVNTGDKIPVDGKVVWGSALIDESMLTGESLPVNKTIEDNLIGGTIITSGSIKMQVTSVGDDMLISQIITLVRNAEENKPKIQRLGDKVSGVFVPLVLLIAISTYFLSSFVISYFSIETVIEDPFLRAIAVLVISCPCAMGLATPTAVMVGIGRAAKKGILLKGGGTLEKLASIKNIVFDKTGTLTTGDFSIKEITILEGDEQFARSIIYNLEKHSSHPIARSLVKNLKANTENLSLTDIKEEKGVGISAWFDTDFYQIGSKRISENLTREHDLYLLRNNKVIAYIDIEDELKKDTEIVINKIKSMGIDTILLSGDKAKKCEDLHQKISFSKVFSEQLPKEKLMQIEKLVSTNPTAMFGDGINDAPALAKATVGISIGNATEVAIQSSDVILLHKSELSQLSKALQVARATLLTIKQNLFWAFSYNIVAIPIAAMGFLDPMLGALFMAFSDVIVIGNSIRLKYKKIF